MRIIFDPNALEATEERLFPASKHRSKRIHKKLVKRHGGVYRKRPCMFVINGVIVAHPIYKPEIEAHFRATAERVITQQRDHLASIFGGLRL